MRKFVITDNAGVQHLVTVEPNQHGIEFLTKAPGMLCPILPVPWMGARYIFAAEKYMVEELVEEAPKDVVKKAADDLMDDLDRLLD